MQVPAVVWCQFCTVGLAVGVGGRVRAAAVIIGGVNIDVGAMVCGSAIVLSCQSFRKAWWKRSDGVVAVEVADVVVTEGVVAVVVASVVGLSWWMWQARAGRAPETARNNPEAAKAVVNHERPLRPARPCDAVMGFDVLIGGPPGSRRTSIHGETVPGVRSEAPIVARTPRLRGRSNEPSRILNQSSSIGQGRQARLLGRVSRGSVLITSREPRSLSGKAWPTGRCPMDDREVTPDRSSSRRPFGARAGDGARASVAERTRSRRRNEVDFHAGTKPIAMTERSRSR